MSNLSSEPNEMKINLNNEINQNNTKEQEMNLSDLSPEVAHKIKDLEIQLSKKDKQIFDIESQRTSADIRIRLLEQENANLKLGIKKAQLSINSPGRVISSLGKQIKSHGQSDITISEISKEKAELKESNEKLLLVISEKESELCQMKASYETTITDLNNQITTLNAKLSDLNSDLADQQNQINLKEKQLETIESSKNILARYNMLRAEYDQLKSNSEKEAEMAKLNNDKIKHIENQNAQLNERVTKIEKEFNELLSKGTITCNAMDDLSCYVMLSENMRNQIISLDEEKATMEKKYIAQIKKNRTDYKNLEDKYLETYEQITKLQGELESSQEQFLAGTMNLNKEITSLNTKISNLNKEKNDLNVRLKSLLDKNTSMETEFRSIQDTMTKLREKDDIDITLIEERYIVLENMLEMEKSDLITQNRDLLNKVKSLQKNEMNCVDLLLDEDKLTNYVHEIKILNEENRLLQFKIKEQEKTILQYEKLNEENRILQTENSNLKHNMNENNNNYEMVIKDLTIKASQLNNELLESRKRTSLLRSRQSIHQSEKKIVPIDIDRTIELQKEIEKLKREKEENNKNYESEIKKAEDDVIKLKTQLAQETFNKDNEIIKLKNQNRKYYTLLVDNGLIKK